MKVVFMCGSHKRHAYMARKLASTGALAGLVIEQREESIPAAPENIPAQTRELFDRHFQRRDQAELNFFEHAEFPSVPTLKVSAESLNDQATLQFIQGIGPTLLLSYGIHILSEATLNAISGEKWNIHGGLSPWYKGTATHFWPSYMLEPQMTGMTVHDLSQRIDDGMIVHQNKGELTRGDGLHDLACRTVHGFCDELEALLSVAARGEIKKDRIPYSGKLWLTTDWQPAHLHLVYEQYNDQIVDAYLDDRFYKREESIIRQF